MNPNGRVPVIEDDGFVLWESNAIVRYLLAKHAPAAPGIRPTCKRANADKWMDWTTSSFAGPFRTVFWGVLRTPADQQDWPPSTRQSRSAALLAMADQALPASLTCPAMRSAWATFPWAVSFMPGSRCPSNAPRMPHLEAWYARLKQRPAYQKR
jgi:glutathione S-transferase